MVSVATQEKTNAGNLRAITFKRKNREKKGQKQESLKKYFIV
jgi:hypothetical protein